MVEVNTVLGPIDSQELGFTLMHEHVAAFNLDMQKNFGNWIDRADIIESSYNELIEAKKLGVKTIVDATPVNLGRDVSIVKELAERTGINFILATGFYWTDEPFIYGWEPAAIADYLVKEITHGIENTDNVKPNIIKAGTEHHGITPLNYKFLKAVALLHCKTGLPITTHTAAAQEVGLAQQDIFAANGVDLTKVIIGHCGDTVNVEYIKKILDRGSYVGLDRFGLGLILPDEMRIKTVVELCKCGYEKQMLLSHDHCNFLDWGPDRLFEKIQPSWTYGHISKNIIPTLKELGVTQQQIDTMTIDNPRRIFEACQK